MWHFCEQVYECFEGYHRDYSVQTVPVEYLASHYIVNKFRPDPLAVLWLFCLGIWWEIIQILHHLFQYKEPALFVGSCQNLAAFLEEKYSMEVIQKEGLAASALKDKERLTEKAVVNQPLSNLIPHSNKMYERSKSLLSGLKRGLIKQKEIAFDKLMGGSTIDFQHIPTGTLTPGENKVLDIPIVPQHLLTSTNITDYHQANKKNANGATALHVGAIEVIMDCFTSPDSNICGGMLLVDTAHLNPDNAIRSVFVAPFIGGRPIRVLLFPDTLVEIAPNMNSRFKLLCTTSNGDVAPDFNLAMVKVNVAGCAVSLTKTYTPTAYLEQELIKEKGAIVQYLNRHTFSMHRNNQMTKEEMQKQRLSFRLESALTLQEKHPLHATFCKSTNFVYKIGGDAKEGSNGNLTVNESQLSSHSPSAHVLHKHNNSGDNEVEFSEIGVVVPGAGRTKAYGQNELDLAQLSLDDTSSLRGTALQTKLATSRIILSKTMVGNTVLREDLLATFLQDSNERAAIDLIRTHVIRGKIRCVASINVPENTGCALAICFNSGITGAADTDIYTTSSQDAIVWNPACEKAVELTFNPNPCGDAWNFVFLQQTKAHFAVQCVTGWTTTPLTDLALVLTWHIDRSLCVPKTLTISSAHASFPINRWMGKLSFPQGPARVLKRMPLAIGGGAGTKDAILMNMPNAVISLHRYFRGDFVFEITKMSSPYIKATIAFFIAFGDITEEMTNLESFPHKLVQFAEIQGRTTITFTQSEFLTAWSTQVLSTVDPQKDGCPHLYALLHDSATSTIEGNFVIGVKLLDIRNYRAYGHNPGFEGARLLGISGQSTMVQQLGTYNPIWMVRTPLESTAQQNFASFTADLMESTISGDSTGNWNITVYPSPIANLLKVAAWKKGTIRFQLICRGAAVKQSDWAASARIDLINNLSNKALPARSWYITKPRGGDIEFDLEIAGPNNGFEMANSSWAFQTTWYLEIAIDNPKQFTLFELNACLMEDFEVAGNTLNPPILLS
uniref:RNA2 polyprotein n=1 Tax=Squash mosaic virus TaxID=12263 RepID=Q9YWJ9_9SECO|nr:polyprotein 2 [Squash mosaic virus]